jgi:hypothetical protein
VTLRGVGCLVVGVIAVFGVIYSSAQAAEDSPPAREMAPTDHPRARLFKGSPEDALRPGARWTVLFVPRIEACTPQEVYVVKALKRVALEFSDLEVLTVIPQGLSSRVIERGVFGEAFPGRLIKVSAESWRQEERVAPRPRVEVWSGRGELLLMRSIPSSISEEALYEEVLWTRAFTEPAQAPAARENR